MNVLDSFRLDGKVAVISGASSGLGVQFAVSLAEAGADVVLAARRVARLAETAQRVHAAGREALTVPADVSKPEDCEAIVAAATDRFGQIDLLVNNAGVGTAVPALRETPEQFRQVIEVNLMGAYWLAQACARAMRPGSAIVNISSVLAYTTAGLPQAAYSASKAAVVGLTRDLAQQWAQRRGIRVNAIAPGYIASEMTAVYDDDQLAKLTNRTLLGRLGSAEEIAATIVWLASAAGGYMCGQTVIVDGGFSVT
jgi:NAD(P)-dependent dehydrogenase (short-subunit alcohol dehydrogenase family)